MTTWQGRLRQTLQQITAWSQPVQDDQAALYLSAAEFHLYRRMARSERQHHLRVFNDLRRGGHTHLSLLKAALLHDVGKMRYRFWMPERVLVVLAKKFLPRKFAQWSQTPPPYGWKRPFVISVHHPAWSAEMTAAVGTDPLTIELIARHQTPLPSTPQTEADHLLMLLQAADDRS